MASAESLLKWSKCILMVNMYVVLCMALCWVTCVHQQAKPSVAQAIPQKHGFVSAGQMALQEFLVKWRFSICFDNEVAMIAFGKTVVL